ncbi:MAG: hypothetical protein E7679_00430 [Ruminococcaceae bacterium]|nr:hypothetical protein [Oscillospiraceae bacterium]
MKRHVKMSLVLVALLLAFAFIFTGCNDELAAKVDENATAAQNAADAANKVQSNLDAAKTELAKDIAANEAAAKKALTDLEAAKAALDKAIKDGDAADAAALVAKAEALETAIKAAKDAITTLETSVAAAKDAADAALEDAIEAVEALEEELEDAIADAKAAVSAAALQLKAWDDATDAIISGAEGASLKALSGAYAEYEAVKDYYFAADYAEIAYQYDAAYLRMIRATSVDAVKAAYDTFVEEAAKLPTIPTSLYNALMAAGETVEDLVYDEDVEENLVKARTILGAVDVMSAELKVELMDQINAYGEDDVDLAALYNTYIARYGVLTMINGGEELLADINEALEALTVPTSDYTAIRSDVTTWTTSSTTTLNGDVTNDVAAVEGLQAAIDALTAAENRAAALVTAYAEAEALNAQIAALKTAIEADGATVTNETALDALKTSVNAWVDTYFSGAYAEEKATETEEGSVNYNKVDYEALEEVNELFLAELDSFAKASKVFEDAVAAIGEVDLLSADEIQAAWDAYYAWIIEADLRNFDYATNPTATYLELVEKDTEYKALVEEALAAYNEVALADDFAATLYNANKINAVLAWYEHYAVVEGGVKVFEDGYVLSDTLTITAADLAKVEGLYADYEALKAAKAEETAKVQALIEAIGTVTMNDKAAIEAAEAAYAAWLAGTNAPEGYTAAQFALDEDNTLSFYVSDDVLRAARTAWNGLNAQVTAIKTAIADLDDKKDVADFNADIAEYTVAVNAIKAAIETFKTANGGDLEGNVTDAEFAKLYAGAFAIEKYNVYAALVVEQEAANATVNGLAISDLDKTTTKNAIAAIVEKALEDIEAVYVAADNADAAARKADIDAIKALAAAKIDAIEVAAGTYKDYVVAVEADATLAADEVAKAEVVVALNTSYVNNVMRIKAALNAANADTFAAMVATQLEAVYPITTP